MVRKDADVGMQVLRTQPEWTQAKVRIYTFPDMRNNAYISAYIYCQCGAAGSLGCVGQATVGGRILSAGSDDGGQSLHRLDSSGFGFELPAHTGRNHSAHA
jgi:hypothetical protein